MRRTSFRFSALVFALLFFVSATKEAFGLGCPHHELGPSTEQAQLLADADSTPASAEVCTCLGNCNGTPSTPPPGKITAPLQAPGTTVTTSLGPELEADLPGPVPYLLPLANAPPLGH
jgi:hypothetical protein